LTLCWRQFLSTQIPPITATLFFNGSINPSSLPQLALQVAWARDPLFRATTPAIMEASEGDKGETASLAQVFEATFPNQYSELNRNKIGRNFGL